MLIIGLVRFVGTSSIKPLQNVVARTDERIPNATELLAETTLGALVLPSAPVGLRVVVGGFEEDNATRLLLEHWCVAPNFARSYLPIQS